MKVVERFFLNRVDMRGNNLTVVGDDHPAVLIVAPHAYPGLALGEFASNRTEIAHDPSVIKNLEIACFVFHRKLS